MTGFNENDEDVMFQEAAQSLIDQANDGKNDNPDGGMPPADPPIPPVEEPPATPPADEVIPPPATPEVPAAAPVIEPINFEGISSGLVKTPEDITRISGEYRAMQEELVTLREQVKRNPFANEWMEALNQMQVDGKSPEQVKTFIQLQELGDISKLPPIEAMVQAKVLRDGLDADLARKMIERKYEIREGMEDLDREIAEGNMKVDAKQDYEYLNTQKKELATPLAKTPPPAVNVLSQEAIRSQVEPIKEKVKEQFSSLGEVNLNGKVDNDGKPTADAVLFDLPIPNEFREKIPALLEDYFINSNTPVTKENLETAVGILNYELFNQFGVRIIQDAVNHALSVQDKKIRAEYSNNNPQKPERVNQPVNAMDLSDAQLDQYVSGE